VARTKLNITAILRVLAAAVLIATAAACDDTARGVKQDAERVEAETRDERAKAAAKAREVGQDVRSAAERAAGAAAEAGEELAERASAATQTLDVKSALMADPAVDATRIDVDTDYRTRTLTLKGYVPTDAEKTAAEAIAKAQAEGYTIVNSLVVRPRS
jgi:osmotically-inducible protein OsmY